MAALSHSGLSRLIGSIYDCALDPSLWGQTLAEIIRELDCGRAILSLNDRRRDLLLIDKSIGWDPCWLEERKKHVPEIHARLNEWLENRSLDEPFVGSRHIAPEYAQTSRYVRECLGPQGIVDVAHFFLADSTSHFSEFVVFRHERQGVVTEREIEHGLLLLPHMRRAVTISKALDISVVERNCMAEALDALRCGVILTDERGVILHANRSAEGILRDGDPIASVRGALQAKGPSASRELRRAIALAVRDESEIGRTGAAICLTTADAPPMFAHVLPLAGGDLRARLLPDAAAAVFISSTPDNRGRADLVAAAYGLTRAETRVISRLLAGRTLAETAVELGIAISTTKTHLDRIFSKTGVSRQADLIRLAMQAPPFV